MVKHTIHIFTVKNRILLPTGKMFHFGWEELYFSHYVIQF